MTEGYSLKDGGLVGQLSSVAAYVGAGVREVQLRPIGGSVGEADEPGCGAMMKDSTGFFELLLICNKCGFTGRLGKL